MSRYRVVAAAAVLALLAVLIPATVSGATPATGEGVEVIVVLDEAYAPGGHEANRARAAEVARSHGLAPTHTYGTALFGFSATVPEGRLAGLERDRRVAFVQENRTLHALGYPTGVKRIDGDDVHNLTTGRLTGAGIKVAVLDTGIDKDHPDLPKVGVGKNCIEGSEGAGTDDDQGHGTHVAGTIGAKIDGTVTGVAPDVDLIPVKVLDSSGSGEWAEVICGIDFVAEQRIPVANLSLGAQGSFDGMTCDSATDPLFLALCNAIGLGTTFTVAAGNDGIDASGFVPAAHPDVITVSAYSDKDGAASTTTSCSGRGLFKTCDEAFASFSNYGSIVDVIAPGVNITSTTMGGGTGTKSGTSMAAPHVAGVVALLLEKLASSSTSMSPAQIEAYLKATGQCPDTLENGGTGVCTGQSWHSDPDGVAEPMANALFAQQGDLVVTTGDFGGGDGGGGGDEGTGEFSLKVTAYKAKGVKMADLSWSGAGSTSVDVYRNGAFVTTTANDGAHTDTIDSKGGGSYTYKVCEAGATTTCSNEVTVTF